MEELAKAAGYKHASGLQHYERADYAETYLPIKVARKLGKALAGRGTPPIHAAEVVEDLAGVSPIMFADDEAYDDTLPARRTPDHRSQSFPIYATIHPEQDGKIYDDAVEYGWWPPELRGVRDAFGIYAPDHSMTDAGVPAGTICHLNRHRPPRSGDLCLVVLRGKGSVIRKYAGATKDGTLVLARSNPAGEERIEPDSIDALYLVTGLQYR